MIEREYPLKWLPSKFTCRYNMDPEKLKYFENLCDKLYGGSGGLEAQKAGDELTVITKNSAFINDVQ